MSNTDFNHWFLAHDPQAPNSIDEFLNPDRLLFQNTSGNKVEVLVDGKSYMQRLYDIINLTGRAGPGDFIYYAGLELMHSIPLAPNSSQSTSIVDVLSEAHNIRGVDVKVLLSSHLKAYINVATFKALWENNIQCVLDISPRTGRGRAASSAHQKFSCIYAQGKFHGFCGGIDVSFDRWDTEKHDPSDVGDGWWRVVNSVQEFPGGWHDVHTYIQGLACSDLLDSFAERWNFIVDSPTSRCQYNLHYQPTAILPHAFPGDPFGIADGTHNVQVLRTYPCPTIPPFELPFAKRGEMSAREACLKAIRQAEHMIYIEDQYFYSYEIANALIAALLDPNKPHLRVLVLVAREPSTDKYHTYANYYHNEVLELIYAAIVHTSAEQRFSIWHLESSVLKDMDGKFEQIYVHAKVMIIDDAWVEIGSMNCNRRSMTNDFEMCVAIVDDEKMTIPTMGEVCKFAHELRLRLWAEHIGLTPPEVPHDPIAGWNLWLERANGFGTPGPRGARHHSAATSRGRYWNIFYGDLWPSIDIEGTCPSETRIPPL